MENNCPKSWEKANFGSEYILHKLTEKFIKEEKLFGLKFVASEIQNTSQIQQKKLRYDTLAFDKKEKAFVIIEYKNKIDEKVLNQAQNYYDLIKEHPQKFADRLSDEEDFINFDNTRVILIGPRFKKDQVKKGKNIDYLEMYKISLYECDEEKRCVIYKNINEDDKNNFNEIRFNVNQKDLEITKEDTLKNKSLEIKELYGDFEKKLSQFQIKYLVDAVSIKSNDKSICNVEIKKSIKIYFYTHKLNEINKYLDEKNCSKKNLRNIAYLTTGGPLVYFELTLDHSEIDFAIKIIEKINEAKKEKQK